MKKYLKYFVYIMKHKYYIMKEMAREGLFWQGLVHDSSKFRPSEFLSYATHFYGNPKDFLCDYRQSRLFHQNRNPHHWQYWLFISNNAKVIFIEIPTKYIIEMFCDWNAVHYALDGIKNPDDKWQYARKWYTENTKNILLHPKTRKEVESLLGVTNG